MMGRDSFEKPAKRVKPLRNGANQFTKLRSYYNDLQFHGIVF